MRKPAMSVSVVPVLAILSLSLAVPWSVTGQQDAEPVFRAGVDLVTVAAVVRDKQGRVAPRLTRSDFTILDNGQSRPIEEFQADMNGPISVGLLIDGSGSMRQSAAVSRRVGEILLSLLNPKTDDVSLMSFDTRLLRLREFTSDFDQLRRGLGDVDTWGASSIYDAIAGGAGVVDAHTQKRRALLVVTDGSDNWSRYSAEQAAWIASTIDVPVYVLDVTVATPDPPDAPVSGGELGAIARATGGDFYAADTDTRQARALGRMISDLRHQYLIAFEPSAAPGLRRLEIRTSEPSLRVRARQWYSGRDH